MQIWSQEAQPPCPPSDLPRLLQLHTDIQHISSEALHERQRKIHSQDPFESLIPQEFCQ